MRETASVGTRAGTARARARARARALAGAFSLLLVATAAGCSSVGGGGAAASCAVKEIVLGDSDLRPGGHVQLSVDWMTARCEDTGGTNQAAEDVDVTLTSTAGAQQYLLGTVEAASGSRFTVEGTFDLPDDLAPGGAVLVVRSGTGEQTGAELPIEVAAG